MSSQLSLKIVPRLPYVAEQFIIHSGVSDAIQDARALLSGNHYGLLSISGVSRSGKTHLSVHLSAEMVKLGLAGRLLEGKEFSTWLGKGFEKPALVQNEVLIVDDSHEYFSNIQPGESGPFVSLVEEMRGLSGKIILLSSVGVNEFPCDDHALSRLRAGYAAKMGPPQDHEILSLVTSMSRQRGLALTENRLLFVAKRMRRDLASLENYLNRVSYLSNTLNRSVTRPLLADAL